MSVTHWAMLISLRDRKYPNITLFKANLYVSYCTITLLRPQSEKQNLMADWESRPILIWNVLSLIPRPGAGYLRLGVFLLSMWHYININYSWAMSFHSFVNSPSTKILHGKMYTLHSSEKISREQWLRHTAVGRWLLTDSNRLIVDVYRPVF